MPILREKTFIVAEVGSNHDGELSRAIELIQHAADAGADAVKFQLIPPFQPDWIDKLIHVCELNKVEFMATPFEQNGINALRGKVKHWKIAATEAANPDFVDAVLKAANGDTVFISDGATERKVYGTGVIPMACVVKYPALEEDYAFIYQEPWGLSDHTTGTILPSIAVAAGAVAIEKHFTDDKTRPGPDHSFALNPTELAQMIAMVRLTERILNNKKLTITTHVGRRLTWPLSDQSPAGTTPSSTNS